MRGDSVPFLADLVVWLRMLALPLLVLVVCWRLLRTERTFGGWFRSRAMSVSLNHRHSDVCLTCASKVLACCRSWAQPALPVVVAMVAVAVCLVVCGGYGTSRVATEAVPNVA